MDTPLTRRELLERARRLGLALGGASLAAGCVSRRRPITGNAPSPPLANAPGPAGASGEAQSLPTVGLIGCGGMGRSNARELTQLDVPIAAVCDVDAGHAAEAAGEIQSASGTAPDILADYRELLDRDDITAVVISTPDHWHALPAIEAAQAGKDIYLEKPVAHSIVEGRRIVEAARKHARIVQVGAWQRSKQEFLDAIDFVRSGQLGKITTVRAWKTDEFELGQHPAAEPPAGLDYDFWVGPAEMTPYTEASCHFNWRWFFNTGCGMTGDWGIHLLDIALLGMSDGQSLPMPSQVSSYGGKLAWPNDDRTTPDTQVALMEFDGWVLHWETGRRPLVTEHDHGVEFIAADGSALLCWRGGWQVTDAEGAVQQQTEDGDAAAMAKHMRNWLECIASRQAPVAPVDALSQVTDLCHLANIAYLTGGPVRWDAARSDVSESAARQTLPYERAYRLPWRLPRVV